MGERSIGGLMTKPTKFSLDMILKAQAGSTLLEAHVHVRQVQSGGSGVACKGTDNPWSR